MHIRKRLGKEIRLFEADGPGLRKVKLSTKLVAQISSLRPGIARGPVFRFRECSSLGSQIAEALIELPRRIPEFRVDRRPPESYPKTGVMSGLATTRNSDPSGL